MSNETLLARLDAFIQTTRRERAASHETMRHIESELKMMTQREAARIGGGLGFTLSAWVYRTLSGSSWDRVIDFGSGQDTSNVLVGFGSSFSLNVRHGTSNAGVSVSSPARAAVDRSVCVLALGRNSAFP